MWFFCVSAKNFLFNVFFVIANKLNNVYNNEMILLQKHG